ncbi:MAG: hypothetical protein LBI19_02085 [Oscillospiraceae bacterium]|nr:hypothetical protein [Oscillospiraceae bacterium]
MKGLILTGISTAAGIVTEILTAIEIMTGIGSMTETGIMTGIESTTETGIAAGTKPRDRSSPPNPHDHPAFGVVVHSCANGRG